MKYHYLKIENQIIRVLQVCVHDAEDVALLRNEHSDAVHLQLEGCDLM